MPNALLIIDMQLAQLSPTVLDIEGVVARIQALRTLARESGVPVFHIRHDGDAGESFAPGSPGWNFIPPLLPDEGEIVVCKQHGSAFHATELHDRLRGLGVDTLLVTGMKTQYCIDAACRGARALDYHVRLVADGHTTADSPILKALDIIRHHNETLRGDYAELVAAGDVRF